MEIDLELVSGQGDKLATRSDINLGHGADELDGGQEDVNSDRYIGHSKKNPVINLDNGVGEVALGFTSLTNETKSYELQNGLEFETKEAAYSFYREHARSLGFGITIKASRRSKKSGTFIDVKIACSRFGSKSESAPSANARSCPKTDCKANMHMKRKPDGKWFIYSFVTDHNHELTPDNFCPTLRGRRQQPSILACQKKGLQLALDEVDVQTLLDYFTVMQDENPNFFYALDFGSDSRMRNVLWVDAKSRNEYRFFSDAVFLDYSYVMDRFRVPLVPILGVNHHFQIILLGCALVGEETSSSFGWIMRTWLRAMGGQAPKAVITHEVDSLKEAITEVFPDASHCYWLWHVLRKTLENLGPVLNGSEKFMFKFKKCLFRSWTDVQFEKKWSKLIDEFELREDKWLRALYESREKWVPAYMGNISLAGFYATERSESISSFLSNYIHKDATLKDFIFLFKSFLLERYEKEAKADFEMHRCPPILTSLSPFEKQMSTVYTPAIFKKFQVEVSGTAACSLQKESKLGEDIIFRVDDFEDGLGYTVAWNETEMRIRCLCRSFEHKGFLCRHSLIVLQIASQSSIPSHYILRRWTNTAKMRQSKHGVPSPFYYKFERFNDICKRAIELGEVGSLSEGTYNTVIDTLHESIQRCVGVNHSVKNVSDSTVSAAQVLRTDEEVDQGQSQAKPSKKKKSNTEQQEQISSGAHRDDSNSIPQQHIPGTLNTIPMGFDHYGHGQSLQGLLQLPWTVQTSFNFQDGLPDTEHGNSR